MAFCYDLISCDEGLYPSQFNLCSDLEIIGVGGQAIAYITGVDTEFYTMHSNGEDVCVCSGALPDMTLPDYKTCGDAIERENFSIRNCNTGELKIIETTVGGIVPLNEPCDNDCSEGYIFNEESGVCERITETPSVYDGLVVVVTAGDNSGAYGWQGANFYSNIDSNIKPVREVLVTPTESYMIDDNGSGVLVNVLGNVGLFWDNTTSINGRLNDIGVWGAGQDGVAWHGFSHCIDVPVTKEYCIGLGADNFGRIKIDGVVVFLMQEGTSSTFSFNYFHVFAITLTAGVHVIEVEGKNASGDRSFGAEIYNATIAEAMAWTNVAELEASLEFSTKDLIGTNFQIGDTNGWTCPSGEATSFCDVGDPVCVLTEIEVLSECQYPIIKVTQSPCQCWEVIDKSEKSGEYVNVEEQYITCRECGEDVGVCDSSERTLAYASKVKLPENITPDRGLVQCCYDNLVLASTSSDLYWENDFKSVFFKKQLPSDTCDFVLVRLSDNSEYNLNNSAYGLFFDFGDFPKELDLTVYKVEWKKVLTLLGSGFYRIKKEITIAGLLFEQLSNTYHLEEFTHERAEATVRIDTVMDGELVHINTGFKDTNFTTSLRIKGYFGKRNPTYTEDSLVKRDYHVEQLSMSLENEYKFETGLIPVCITDELYDFTLFGNEIFINDYNKFNTSYNYLKFAVELSGNKGTKYFVRNRDSKVSLTFKDRIKNKRKLNC